MSSTRYYLDSYKRALQIANTARSKLKGKRLAQGDYLRACPDGTVRLNTMSHADVLVFHPDNTVDIAGSAPDMVRGRLFDYVRVTLRLHQDQYYVLTPGTYGQGRTDLPVLDQTHGVRFDLSTLKVVSPKFAPTIEKNTDKARDWKRVVREFKRGFKVRARLGAFDYLDAPGRPTHAANLDTLHEWAKQHITEANELFVTVNNISVLRLSNLGKSRIMQAAMEKDEHGIAAVLLIVDGVYRHSVWNNVTRTSTRETFAQSMVRGFDTFYARYRSDILQQIGVNIPVERV